MRKTDIDGLLALNLEQIEIVYRRCRGDSVQKVAIDMGLGKSTIWNTRMKEILSFLGLKDWDELEDDLCIALRKIIPSVEALQQGWPEAFREKIVALRDTGEPLKSGNSSSESEITPAPDPPPTKTEGDGNPPRLRVPWPLVAIPLLVLCLLCIGGVVFAGPRLGILLRPSTNIPQAIETSVSTIQATSTFQLSPTIQLTDTLTPTPTDTLTPTPTLTPTATKTPIPTDTKSPIGLVKGDELSDNRVTMKLTDIQYNQKYDRIGAKVAPISFFFDFRNHSGETIVLQIESGDFHSVDNTGYEADCWFYHISGAGQQINEPLNNGATRQIVARCGLGTLNPNVTTVTLTILPFTSLPESTWIAEIPH